jgi:hypothetical protein
LPGGAALFSLYFAQVVDTNSLFYYSIEPAARQELPPLPGKKLAKNAVSRRPAAYKQPVRAPQTR